LNDLLEALATSGGSELDWKREVLVNSNRLIVLVIIMIPLQFDHEAVADLCDENGPWLHVADRAS
jgi:hypothetical protein